MMNEKLHGYDFWKKVLGSPKFVAAPMVDLADLAFRLLTRRYNSQLCYTPMINSNQFLQDEVYRKQVFTTCSQDRPLIAQFCANDPEIFVKAGKMVAPYCDAIDLNLGCPQGIARKGHYGAFLQDDTELIEQLVSRAAKEFPVPVTCKIRILPGPVENTIKYVERLVNAGCSLIAIHGRNILQKGDETGLADWDVIKAVKENVKIPVLANGNILNFDDILSCLEYTKADGIMSAEGLLHNPALFTGKTPLVWEMSEEYLVLAEEHQIPSKIVRTHLFRLLQYSLEELHTMREDLAHASTIDEFRVICETVKRALQSRVTSDCDQNVIYDNLKNISEKKTTIDCDTSKTLIIDADSDWIKTGMFSDELEEIITDINEDDLVYDREVLKEEITPYHLPIWFCHSRPRVPFNSEVKKIKSENEAKEEIQEDGLSKNDKRKQRYHECRLKGRKLKRKDLKVRRKEKQKLHDENSTESEKTTKKNRLAAIRNRLLEARNGSLKVCIDLDYTDLMTNKEQHRLCSQLCRLYGSNRASFKPLHLHFTNCGTKESFYQLCCDKNEGFSNYLVDTSPFGPDELFPIESVVYLSPDSPNVLTSLDMGKVYVIGGFVDDTVKKNVTLRQAESRGIKTFRLPISEHLGKCDKGSFCQVLTVNQVFDILLKYYETRDWVTSLLAGVPRRKGFVAVAALDTSNVT